MIQNKAPNYDNILEDLENNTFTKDVKASTGNVILFRLKENKYGSFYFPIQPNWHILTAHKKPDSFQFELKYIE